MLSEPVGLPERHASARAELERRTREHGKGRCRWCGGELPSGRRSWCSKACVDDYLIRSHAGSAAAAVFERDRGVCAICGRDCEALRVALDRYPSQYIGEPYATLAFWERVYASLRRQAEHAGFSPQKRLWEADHIVPVAEGGGSCGLDNLRTLCQPCHKAETARLARRLADRRRGQLAIAIEAGDEPA